MNEGKGKKEIESFLKEFRKEANEENSLNSNAGSQEELEEEMRETGTGETTNEGNKENKDIRERLQNINEEIQEEINSKQTQSEEVEVKNRKESEDRDKKPEKENEKTSEDNIMEDNKQSSSKEKVDSRENLQIINKGIQEETSTKQTEREEGEEGKNIKEIENKENKKKNEAGQKEIREITVEEKVKKIVKFTSVDEVYARYYLEKEKGHLQNTISKIVFEQEAQRTKKECAKQEKEITCGKCQKKMKEYRIECQKCSLVMCKECAQFEKEEKRKVSKFNCPITGDSATFTAECPGCKTSVEKKNTEKIGDKEKREEKENYDDIEKKQNARTCKYFLGKGCKFGKQCRYLHKIEKCKYFEENRCKFGSHCRNIHRTEKHTKSKEVNKEANPKEDTNVKEALSKGHIIRDAEGMLKCNDCKIQVLCWKQHCSSERHKGKLLDQLIYINQISISEEEQKQAFRMTKILRKKT